MPKYFRHVSITFLSERLTFIKKFNGAYKHHTRLIMQGPEAKPLKKYIDFSCMNLFIFNQWVMKKSFQMFGIGHQNIFKKWKKIIVK